MTSYEIKLADPLVHIATIDVEVRNVLVIVMNMILVD